MGIDTCYPCAKYFLLVLNLFFWLSGLAFVVLGIYFLLHPEVQHVIRLFNLTNFPLSSIEVLACLLILIGTIIFLVGLFGYCGATRESRTCLILYMVLVVSVLLAEIVLFILIALHYEQGQVLFKQRLVSQIKTYNHQHPGQYEKAVDFVQNQYQCCGIDSVYDYSTSHVPVSCCSTNAGPSCTVHHVNVNRTPGCAHILSQTSMFWAKYFLLFELGLCLLSLLGIFLAVCVCQNVMFYDGYIQTFYHV